MQKFIIISIFFSVLLNCIFAQKKEYTIKSKKTIKLFEGSNATGELILEMGQIPTVKVMEGYYEVRQSDELEKQIPVLRLPISNTNMLIKK